jgi:hypothetical protein
MSNEARSTYAMTNPVGYSVTYVECPHTSGNPVTEFSLQVYSFVLLVPELSTVQLLSEYVR